MSHLIFCLLFFFRGEVACFCLSSSVFSCCRLYVLFCFLGSGGFGYVIISKILLYECHTDLLSLYAVSMAHAVVNQHR